MKRERHHKRPRWRPPPPRREEKGKGRSLQHHSSSPVILKPRHDTKKKRDRRHKRPGPQCPPPIPPPSLPHHHRTKKNGPPQPTHRDISRGRWGARAKLSTAPVILLLYPLFNPCTPPPPPLIKSPEEFINLGNISKYEKDKKTQNRRGL